MTRWILALITLGLVAGAAEARGQTPAELVPGARVRVRRGMAPAGQVVGTLTRLTPDSLWVRTAPGEERAIARPEILQVDLSRGEQSRAAEGALIGLGMGATLTAVFLTQFCGGDTQCGGDTFGRAALLFAGPPTAVGAVLGSLSRTERWQPVVLRRPDGQVGLGLSLSW